MTKKNVALIFGSINSEHDISVASAASVMEYFPFDAFNLVPIYIGKDGQWNTGNYTLEAMKENRLEGHEPLALNFDYSHPGFMNLQTQKRVSIDVAFLMLHGQMGEGGHVQGLLKCANIPFTGCDILSSAMCMDKSITHAICEANGIRMAAYQMIESLDMIDHDKIDYPCIVKPCREGSSFGVTYVSDEDELEAACTEAFRFDSRILIEAYIKGVECGVGILSLKDLFIISDVDQVNVSGQVFDFQEKYHPHATETLPLTTYGLAVQEEIKAMASKAFEVMDCDQFARIDFFVTESETVYLNEINTIPGFTNSSRYPKMMARSGVSYTALIQKMIEDRL